MRNKEDNACKSWYRMGCCLVTKSCPTLATSWVVAHQAPCPWDFPGKNTGLGCHFLLQSIFPTQRLNPCLLWLLHWQVDSLLPPGKHYMMGSKSQYMVAIIFIVKFVLENELTHLRNSLIYIFWNVVYLQCHVIFWCTAKWFSYTHTHTHTHIYIYSFSDSLPLWVITRYWV